MHRFVDNGTKKREILDFQSLKLSEKRRPTIIGRFVKDRTSLLFDSIQGGKVLESCDDAKYMKLRKSRYDGDLRPRLIAHSSSKK